MTDCPRYADALLEAELDELRGIGDTPVARHVRGCPRCASSGRRILEAHARLHGALSKRPDLDVHALLARARASAARRGAPPRTPMRRWIALAAAASLAAVLLWTEREPPLDGTPWVATAQAPSVVEAPADRDVAVFETDDPDITVIWFFQEEE